MTASDHTRASSLLEDLQRAVDEALALTLLATDTDASPIVFQAAAERVRRRVEAAARQAEEILSEPAEAE